MPMLVANSDIVSKIANPYGKLGFIRLNCLQPPFDDVRLRRAVMRGVVLVRGQGTSGWFGWWSARDLRYSATGLFHNSGALRTK
jgi:hypothetical protein